MTKKKKTARNSFGINLFYSPIFSWPYREETRNVCCMSSDLSRRLYIIRSICCWTINGQMWNMTTLDGSTLFTSRNSIKETIDRLPTSKMEFSCCFFFKKNQERNVEKWNLTKIKPPSLIITDEREKKEETFSRENITNNQREIVHLSSCDCFNVL